MMKNFVFENASASGTGPFTLLGSPASNPEFGSYINAVGAGEPAFYHARWANGKWEVGFGTVNSGSPNPTLSRNNPCIESWDLATRSTTRISAAGGDGDLVVFIAPVAQVQMGMLTHHRGATAPIYLLPGMIWFDTSGGVTAVLVKMRTASSTWVSMGTLNETLGTFAAAGNYLPLSGGVVTGDVEINGSLTVGTGVTATSSIHIKKSNATEISGLVENTHASGAALWRAKTPSRAGWLGIPAGSAGFTLFDDTASGVVFSSDSSRQMTFPAALFASGGVKTIGGLSSFDIYNSGGNALFQGDSGDYIYLDRSANTWNVVIGGVVVATFASTGMTTGQTLRRFSGDSGSATSIQASGISALGTPRFCIFSGHVAPTGGGGPYMLTVRALDASANVLTTVTLANTIPSGTNFTFWGYVQMGYSGGPKQMWLKGHQNGGVGTLEDLFAGQNGGNTGELDQVQMLFSGSNAVGHIDALVTDN